MHDCFSLTELLSYEDLGFCEKGAAKEHIASGAFELGGELPVNTDGGLKTFGHPTGATGVRMIYENVLQLQGRAGERQVKDADARALATTSAATRPRAASRSSAASSRAVDFETILYEVQRRRRDDHAEPTRAAQRLHRRDGPRAARGLGATSKRDGDVVCAIVTGAGEKAFCTGMDVADVADGCAREDRAQATSSGPALLRYLTAIQNRCWKPVITAVNGMVVGGGLHFIADSRPDPRRRDTPPSSTPT